jgi:Zn-dependent metalloprotease
MWTPKPGWTGATFNSGILNKAFYLVATKRSTKLAAEIWIATLRQVNKAGRIDFPKFAQILYRQAGDQKDAVREALKEVGLDPVTPTGSAALIRIPHGQ